MLLSLSLLFFFNVGYMLMFFLGMNNLLFSYVNMLFFMSLLGMGSGGFGLVMGVGVGVLVVGVMMFGDDFMLGFDFFGGL